ncbi:MAG: hypothetical protein ABJ239_06070 [Erythrobacter sp.]
MNAELKHLQRFEATWRETLEKNAEVQFELQMLPSSSGSFTEIADRFVQSIGLETIESRWKKLDDKSGNGAQQSAAATFVDALSNDMVFSNSDWLGEKKARQCGQDFVDCFKPHPRTILTNREGSGWNPISTATFEWAFVGFDDRKIALLLLMAED